jgi:hypothetical protein
VIQLRTYNAPGGRRTLDAADLADLYAAADPDARPVFFHSGDPTGSLLLVWILDAEHCHVELRYDGRWYDLIESDVLGEVDVCLANIPGTVPRASVVPRGVGLEVLRAAGDLSQMRAAHTWRPVPAWVVDRGEYLLRDIVEALWDRAGELHMRIRFAGVSGEDAPVGLRHLSHLAGFHADAMANGLDWVVDVHTKVQLEAAAAAADYLGLDQIAALISQLAAAGHDFELAQELSEVYWRISGPDGSDASAIREAMRRRIAEAPEEWGLA